MHTDEKIFHAELRKVRGRFQPRQLNNLAFLFSVLSPVRTVEQLFTDTNVESCDWAHIFALASNRLIAPLLFARLQQKQLTNCCPEDFLAALGAFHDANKKRNARQREILLETVSLLNQSDIIPKLLKGAHALVGKMPDHNERTIGDIDLLIPVEQIALARATLLNAGFYNDKSSFSAIDDFSKNSNLPHLSPLFHPSGDGYIELHRFPNHSRKHPGVVPMCFMPKHMLDANEEGCQFYYNHPWQLLFYNQVHHYHSAITARGLLDVRHLAEQSALLHKINDIAFLQRQIKIIFPETASMSHLQFALVSTLFGHKLPTALSCINTKDQRYYRDTLSILQGARSPFYKRKAVFMASLAWQLIRSGRIKNRVFNSKWYHSRWKQHVSPHLSK